MKYKYIFMKKVVCVCVAWLDHSNIIARILEYHDLDIKNVVIWKLENLELNLAMVWFAYLGPKIFKLRYILDNALVPMTLFLLNHKKNS